MLSKLTMHQDNVFIAKEGLSILSHRIHKAYNFHHGRCQYIF